MRVKNIKKILIILLIIIGLLTLMTTTSKAGLQANKEGSRKYNYSSSWIREIRNMEASNGTLGKNATIDIYTLRETSETGNGIDVHMILNTEWGTAALLAASKYGGFPPKDSANSTSGNDSGIFGMADSTREIVSGYTESSWRDLDARYMNVYNNSTEKHNGDAMRECDGWSGASSTGSNFKNGFVLTRCKLFTSEMISTSTYTHGRAALVCGEGL